MDNYTDGSASAATLAEYFEINMPEGFTKSMFPGALVTPSGSGKSFALRNEARFYKALQKGVQTSIANFNLIDKFVMSPQHTSGAIAVYIDYYLIVYFGTNSHLKFTDANGNQQSYCKGIIHSAIGQYRHRDPTNFTVRINWDSEW